MSLKSFLHNIWASLSKLFSDLVPKVKAAIHTGVVITDAIKKFDDSTPWVGDLITTLIPGDVDDKIKDKIREALPNIVIELKLVDAAMDKTKPDEILLAAIAALKPIIKSNAGKDFLDSIAVEISIVASDGRLTWDDAKQIVKWYHDHEYQK
jgi:phage-related minor tail protein